MKKLLTRLLLDVLRAKSTAEKHRQLRREAVARAHKVSVIRVRQSPR